ncbi:hypothetical protein RND71_005684 [Anisodus tanguticus]|uniref:Uncharacterized protein n=1 Tax=Anisodus tanguticus TaxID=243964 RepID=A0AAE1VMY2_9SOLA|nr:hypothetical protein RND71_005684 [Anisodus tanguticus]
MSLCPNVEQSYAMCPDVPYLKQASKPHRHGPLKKLVEMMGSNRREEGIVMVKNSNVFAALDSLKKKKKKSDKGKSEEIKCT